MVNHLQRRVSHHGSMLESGVSDGRTQQKHNALPCSLDEWNGTQPSTRPGEGQLRKACPVTLNYALNAGPRAAHDSRLVYFSGKVEDVARSELFYTKTMQHNNLQHRPTHKTTCGGLNYLSISAVFPINSNINHKYGTGQK